MNMTKDDIAFIDEYGQGWHRPHWWIWPRMILPSLMNTAKDDIAFIDEYDQGWHRHHWWIWSRMTSPSLMNMAKDDIAIIDECDQGWHRLHWWIWPRMTSPPLMNIIARRHGHVFRMALHNEGDWRMETWQRARQGELSCLHSPIPELCNAILNTCQMPSRFYIIPSNVNKSQTHLLKPFITRDLMEGHICRQNTLMFALVFCLNCVHAPPARAVTAISLWKIRFMTASAVS